MYPQEGYLWWSQLHLHLANVHKVLVWQAVYLFMHVSPILNVYFNNMVGYMSKTIDQVLKQPLSDGNTE